VLAGCAVRPALPGAAPDLDLADTALANGAPQLGLTVTQSLLARHPGDAQALLREGRAYVALKQPAEAVDAYRRAVAAQPDFVPALLELGRLLLTSDAEQSRELFTRAVAADPHNATALNDLGIALDMLRRHTEAQQRYRAALAEDRDMAAAQVNLALSLAMSGNLDAALRLIRPIAQGPAATPRVRRDLALLLARSGHDAEAVQVLQGDVSAQEAAHVIARYHELEGENAGGLVSP
jgi:Flp pilus assembly protein TadD